MEKPEKQSQDSSIRLLTSFVAGIAIWFLSELIGATGRLLMVLAGSWFIAETIIFSVKNWKNSGYKAIIFMVWLLSLQILLTIFINLLDLVIGVPPDILQGFIFWYLLSAIVFLILGIWAIIKGIVLVRNKINVKLGIVNLVIGIIVVLPILVFLGILFISILDFVINGTRTEIPFR